MYHYDLLSFLTPWCCSSGFLSTVFKMFGHLLSDFRICLLVEQVEHLLLKLSSFIILVTRPGSPAWLTSTRDKKLKPPVEKSSDFEVGDAVSVQCQKLIVLLLMFVIAPLYELSVVEQSNFDTSYSRNMGSFRISIQEVIRSIWQYTRGR